MPDTVGYFGDKRRQRRGAQLFRDIVGSGSLVQRRVGGQRAGEIAMDRFLGCEEVTAKEMVETTSKRSAALCKGRRVLVAQDTTEVNFSGRDLARRGLGPAGDGKSKGFFIHAAVAVDIEDQAVVGLAAATIWTRKGKVEGTQWQRRFEKKESARWAQTTRTLSECLAEASQLIVVGDRENDIYDVFERCPEGTDLIVRAAQNRKLAEGGKLFEQPSTWKALGRTTIEVISRKPGEKPRLATIEYRAGTVRLCRPKTARATLPDWVELTLVEAVEVDAPKNVEALHWFLLSTLAAETAEQAIEIVGLYRLRWRIEQVFRLLKSDGLKLEELQMLRGDKLMKLSALGLAAAIRLLQLVDARDKSRRPASDVLDEPMIEATRIIVPTLEGKTERQKNHHRPGSLSWVAWAVARLGGWNCYYRPPGPKVMAAGWRRLVDKCKAILLVTNNVCYRT